MKVRMFVCRVCNPPCFLAWDDEKYEESEPNTCPFSVRVTPEWEEFTSDIKITSELALAILIETAKRIIGDSDEK